MDLHLDLSGTRVRAGLESALRDAVRDGRLRPGTRLPSSRALAADLGIARNTVAEVYSQLVAEGWLTAQTGSGTSVAPRRAPDPGARAAARPEVAVPRYDLRAGVPDLSAFPRRAWLATARKVLAAAPDHLLGYPDPRGVPALRAALADYLARARGVTADPAHIVICAGFTHGLAGISRALRSAGASTLAVEAYGHQAHRDIAAGQGLRLRPLPVDGMGAVIGEAAGADAVLLTPAHQFPLGVTLHPRRRREVADWGGVVIEDDYDGEFRYDRQPVGALQTLAPDRVIYAGTASKSLAPGLRLGWLVVPPRLLDAVTAELAAGPSALDQLTLAEFITRAVTTGRSAGPGSPTGAAGTAWPPPSAVRACRSRESPPACRRCSNFPERTSSVPSSPAPASMAWPSTGWNAIVPAKTRPPRTAGRAW